MSGCACRLQILETGIVLGHFTTLDSQLILDYGLQRRAGKGIGAIQDVPPETDRAIQSLPFLMDRQASQGVQLLYLLGQSQSNAG